MPGLLFLCTGNSCRSQMAEGFARALAPGALRVFSAGLAPSQLHPLAIRVMGERGIDITVQRSKSLDAVPIDAIDHLVTLCSHAEQSCPAFPGAATRRHWPLADPATARGTEAEVLAVFRAVRDEIQARVRALIEELGQKSAGEICPL